VTQQSMDMETRPLPAGWKWVKLGDVIAKVQPGYACGDRDEGGVVQLRMNNVSTNGTFNWSELTRVPSDYKDITTYQLEPQDVLFNNTNSAELVGKSALFTGFSEPLVFSNHFSRLRPQHERLEPTFLARWLLHKWTDGTFARICNRWVGQAAVPNKKLLELPIPLPPLPEQKRIAAILNEQMAAVDKARRAAQERLEAARALPAAYLREVFEGEEAREWQTELLGNYMIDARNGFGRRPKENESGVIVLRIADVSSGVVDLSSPRRGYMSEKEQDTYLLTPGDLLFIRVNGSESFVGKCVLVPETIETLAFNDHLVRVKVEDSFQPEFLAWFLNCRMVRSHMIEYASTSAGQLTINQQAIASIKVPVIEKKTQKQIVTTLEAKVSAAKKVQRTIQDELDSIDLLPSALLRKAFAGEL
jgi:type I restriction enzyme S subunit